FAEHFPVKKRDKQSVVVQVADESASGDLLRYLVQRNVRVKGFNEILPTFNEIFIRRVGETAE
ncbi:MAG TPA: DUF4162 domain-containing protein, partial [Saprospiraceae bacterium]|nr:DUF4162 domain-containing protein [Saprospiraceae bacterium]